MSEGFAYHRIVLNSEGKPCDCIFQEVNDGFEKLTGLKGENILGKRVTEVLPGIEKDPTDWIGKYGNVPLTGKPIQFESHAKSPEKWYSVSAFSPHKGYFAVTFSDITERKRMELALRESEETLRVTLTSIGDAVIATDVHARITFMNTVAEVSV
jgi:PAS domain S-box-containing protein